MEGKIKVYSSVSDVSNMFNKITSVTVCSWLNTSHWSRAPPTLAPQDRLPSSDVTASLTFNYSPLNRNI